MNKLYSIVFIIGFWFFLPIPYMLLEMNSYDSSIMFNIRTQIEKLEVNKIENETYEADFWTKAGNFIDSLATFSNIGLQLMVLFFQILILGIPNAPVIINYFLWFLKIISAIVLYLLVRGN